MNTFAQNIQAEDCLDAEQHAELQAYLDGSLEGIEQDFDRDFPFDDSQSDEKHPGFTNVFCGNDKFNDVNLFRMFDVVGNKLVKTANGGLIEVERPLFKTTKTTKKLKREIGKIDQNKRAERVAAFAAYYQNPQNEGVTPISSIFEAVENNEPIHLSPLMLALLGNREDEDE